MYLKIIIHFTLKKILLILSLFIICTCSSSNTILQLAKPHVQYVLNDDTLAAQIIWYPVDYASYYRVMRSENNQDFIEVMMHDPQEQEPSYIDQSLDINNQYYYQIEVCNIDFDVCATSDTLVINSAIEYGLGIPQVPESITIENPTESSLELRGDFLSRTSYYRVLSSRKQNRIEVENINTLSLKQLDKGVYLEYTYGQQPIGYILKSNFLRASTEYFYRVSACNMLGCSPYSTIVSGITTNIPRSGVRGKYLGLSTLLAKIPLSFYRGFYNYLLSPILLLFDRGGIDLTEIPSLTGTILDVSNNTLSDILSGNTDISLSPSSSDSTTPSSFDGLLSFFVSPIQAFLENTGLSNLVSLPINTSESTSSSGGGGFGVATVIGVLTEVEGLLKGSPKAQDAQVQTFMGGIFKNLIDIAHDPGRLLDLFDQDALQALLNNSALIVGITDPAEVGINASTLIDPSIINLVEDYLLGYNLSDIFTISTVKDFLSGFSFIDFPSEEIIFYGAEYSQISFTTHYKGKPVSTSGSICIPLGPGQEPLQDAPILNFYHPTKTNNSGLPTDSKIGFTSGEVVDLINNLLDSNPNNDDILAFFTTIENFIQISLYEFYCWFGFITFAPNYIGYKETDDILHPFLNRQYSIEIAQDMLKAGLEYLEDPDKKENTDNEIRHNGRIYLAGYSEGAYVALSFLEYLENNPEFLLKNNLTLSGTITGGGSYDLTQLTDIILSEGEYPVPAFLLYFLQSNLDAYSINSQELNINDILQTNYDVSAFSVNSFVSLLEQENILSAGYQGEEKEGFLEIINNNTNMKNFFQNDFYAQRLPQQFNFEEENSILSNISLNRKTKLQRIERMLTENSIEPWSLRTPLRLLHATHDEVIPIATSANLCHQIKQINLKAPVSSNTLLDSLGLQLILDLLGSLLNFDLSFQNHTIAGVEYIIEALNWLNILEVRYKKQLFLEEAHRTCNL